LGSEPHGDQVSWLSVWLRISDTGAVGLFRPLTVWLSSERWLGRVFRHTDGDGGGDWMRWDRMGMGMEIGTGKGRKNRRRERVPRSPSE